MASKLEVVVCGCSQIGKGGRGLGPCGKPLEIRVLLSELYMFLKKRVFLLILLSGLGFGFFIVELTGRNDTKLAIEATELFQEGYEKIRNDLIFIVRDQNPKAALAQLAEQMQMDNALLRSCHPLVHEIGHEAYERYRDFGEAMKYQDEVCNSGYLHGVIEAHFAGSADIFTAKETICTQYRPGSFFSWECYHGVGHGFMYYTANDLPQSLGWCDSYENEFARSSCINGVFMENFNTDQKFHPSQFLKGNDPFYPCAEQERRHKGDCYVYAPIYFLSLHKDQYVKALEWCEGAESAFRSTCVAGVGSQALKENIASPKFVESVCMAARREQIAPCINGVVKLYINYHGSLDPARELCEQLEISNRETCYHAVQTSERLFATTPS